MAGDAIFRDIDRIDRKLADLENAHAEVRSDVRSIREDVARLKDAEVDYITRIEFAPVRQITFGAVAVVLLAVMTALVALVIRK